VSVKYLDSSQSMTKWSTLQCFIEWVGSLAHIKKKQTSRKNTLAYLSATKKKFYNILPGQDSTRFRKEYDGRRPGVNLIFKNFVADAFGKISCSAFS
jgi:hypothetical protein